MVPWWRCKQKEVAHNKEFKASDASLLVLEAMWSDNVLRWLKETLCHPPVDSKTSGLNRGPRSGYFFIFILFYLSFILFTKSPNDSWMFPSLLLVAPSVFASSLPVKCLAVDAPVCGDDGVTYPNECELNANNVKKQFDGKCRCKCTRVTPLVCPVPKTCSKGFEYGGCRPLCNQKTCKLELLAPGCVRIISPPEPRK